MPRQLAGDVVGTLERAVEGVADAVVSERETLHRSASGATHLLERAVLAHLVVDRVGLADHDRRGLHHLAGLLRGGHDRLQLCEVRTHGVQLRADAIELGEIGGELCTLLGGRLTVTGGVLRKVMAKGVCPFGLGVDCGGERLNAAHGIAPKRESA